MSDLLKKKIKKLKLENRKLNKKFNKLSFAVEKLYRIFQFIDDSQDFQDGEIVSDKNSIEQINDLGLEEELSFYKAFLMEDYED